MNPGHHAALSGGAIVALAVGLFVLSKLPKMAKGLLKQVVKDYIAVVVWRHFTGAHHHGNRVTDAGWWSHGTSSKREYDHGSFMDRWEHKPRAHRLLWRWACWIAFLGTAYGLIFARVVTEHALIALIVYGFCVALFVIEAWWRERLHRNRVLNPIAKSLAPHLRLSVHAVRKMLHFKAENLSKDEGEIGYLGPIPASLTPSDDLQATIQRIIDTHLPVDIELQWQLDQKPRIAVARAGLTPPADVPWDSMITEMEKCTRGQVVFGRDRDKQAYGADFLGADDPHWAMLVNTKRGKSNWLAVVVAQVLHQDSEAEAVVIDPKRSSLIDFLGSPNTGPGLKPLIRGVHMACDPAQPQQMIDAVAGVRATLDERSKVMARDRYAKFPIKLLVLDEMTQLQEIIDDYWREQYAGYRAMDKEDREAHPMHPMPKECPFWADFRLILRTGRFVGIHVIAVGQDLRDTHLGGKGTRSYFGLRGMAGYRKNQWDYFMGTSPAHRDIGGIGRWIFAQGDADVWVQITHGDPDKVYAWAMHGRGWHDSAPIPGASVPALPSVTSSPFSDPEPTDGHDAKCFCGSGAHEPVIGLKAAARHLGMSHSAFEKRRQRVPVAREGRISRQPAWCPRDLEDWRRPPGSSAA